MNKTLPKQLNPVTLRLVLLGVLALLLLAQIGLIILGRHTTSSYAQQVASTVSLSSSNKKTLDDLETVNTKLEQQKSIVDKSKYLIADKTNPYAYQNQIIQDITRYANLTGIQVTGFAFADAAGAAASGASGSAPAPATAATPAAGASVTPPGVSTTTVTVTFAQSATYDSFYKFLQLLEGNLLHMEINGVSLSRPASGDVNANSVALTTLTIQVYKAS